MNAHEYNALMAKTGTPPQAGCGTAHRNSRAESHFAARDFGRATRRTEPYETGATARKFFAARSDGRWAKPKRSSSRRIRFFQSSAIIPVRYVGVPNQETSRLLLGRDSEKWVIWGGGNATEDRCYLMRRKRRTPRPSTSCCNCSTPRGSPWPPGRH